jgi:hypothetical protein
MQDSVAELPPVPPDDVPSRRLRTVAVVWPLALAGMLLGHLARRRAKRTGFADAEHVGVGWIELGDGRRIHAPAAAALALAALGMAPLVSCLLVRLV